MDLSENRTNNPNLITQAQANQCVIGNQTHIQSIIIPSDSELVPCNISSVSELTEGLIDQLCAYNPEVLILATGEHIIFPDAEILQPLVNKHIGLEVLNNQAAARTFNVLLAENRQTVCLMIIDPEQL
jgi:uncharacterized protein